MVSEDDIFGPEDLNGLLRKFPDIEQAHIKLWLTGTAVLERVLRSAASTFSAMSKADIEDKVRVYAPNPSFKESRDKLETSHVVIISGPPGVGKTTLAEMLAYAYIGDEWEFLAIRSLDDGFAAIVDAKKQIFFFDDFLGKIALDKQALAAKDSDLARFINRIRRSPNARFVLTTRAYIFEEARRVSEHLADHRLDVTRYVLDVGIYTRRIRARILYNHLLVGGVPHEHVRMLIESGYLPRIIDHKNYNPRIVEWMTDILRIKQVTPDTYPAVFLDKLDNPDQLWDTAFRTHISGRCRHLLYALFFSSQFGAELSDLRVAFDAVHPVLSRKYGLSSDPKDFEEAIRILEGGFIKVSGTSVSFINPSLHDYLARYLSDQELMVEFARCAPRARWAKAVWDHGKGDPLEPNDVLANGFSTIAAKFTSLPVWERTRTAPHSFRCCDIDGPDRIGFLLDLWSVTGNSRYAALAVDVATDLPGGFDPWDGRQVVELIVHLRDGDYYEGYPYVEELVSKLEEQLASILQRGMASDDLEAVADAIHESPVALGANVAQELSDAILREVNDMYDVAGSFTSESEIEDHMNLVARLAEREQVPKRNIEDAMQLARGRIEELGEQTSRAGEPSFSRTAHLETDSFDDDAVQNLFASLLC